MDGDGIPYRTIPGDGMPAYFARGSGHNARASTASVPTTTSRTWTGWLASSRPPESWCPQPAVEIVAGCRDLASSGMAHLIGPSRKAAISCEKRPTSRRSYFRLRAYPFTEKLVAFIDAHERVYVVEQNRDAQLMQLMKLELSPERQSKLRSVLHYSGLPIDARSISDDVLSQEGYEVAKKTARVGGAGMTGGE